MPEALEYAKRTTTFPEILFRKTKSPVNNDRAFCLHKQLGSDLLSHAECTLSSAQRRFTVLFGMGRSGTTSLLPPSLTCRPACVNYRKQSQSGRSVGSGFHVRRHEGISFLRELPTPEYFRIQGYRIKPHGQLVSVSLTCYHASTPDLSTSWSRTTL